MTNQHALMTREARRLHERARALLPRLHEALGDVANARRVLEHYAGTDLETEAKLRLGAARAQADQLRHQIEELNDLTAAYAAGHLPSQQAIWRDETALS